MERERVYTFWEDAWCCCCCCLLGFVLPKRGGAMKIPEDLPGVSAQVAPSP